jgi:hypothetical protein
MACCGYLRCLKYGTGKRDGMRGSSGMPKPEKRAKKLMTMSRRCLGRRKWWM